MAVPRDVSPQAKHIPNIVLYDLDDLKSVTDENFTKRKREAKRAEEIIKNKLCDFIDDHTLCKCY